MSIISFLENFRSNIFNRLVVIPVGSIILVIVSAKLYYKRKECHKRESYPKDVVILHQFPRAIKIPSPSPFVLKLETWLRMADIVYQCEYSYGTGPKGKVPWITYNQQDIADSEFCIEFLSRIKNIDLSKNVTPSDKGAARAFVKMSEESILWCLAMQRFIFDWNDESGIPKKIRFLYKKYIKKCAYAQGYGRHSKEEVQSICKNDLKAINDFLNGKKYLTGNQACTEDASVFAMCAQFIYTDIGLYNQFIINECPNIVSYVENMKNVYWPDWNNLVAKKNN